MSFVFYLLPHSLTGSDSVFDAPQLSRHLVRTKGCPFKALERVSVLVSPRRPRPITCPQPLRGGAGFFWLPSLPFLCQTRVSELSAILQQQRSVSARDPAPTPQSPRPAAPSRPAWPRAVRGATAPFSGDGRGTRRCLISPFPAPASPDLLRRRPRTPRACRTLRA